MCRGALDLQHPMTMIFLFRIQKLALKISSGPMGWDLGRRREEHRLHGRDVAPSPTPHLRGKVLSPPWASPAPISKWGCCEGKGNRTGRSEVTTQPKVKFLSFCSVFFFVCSVSLPLSVRLSASLCLSWYMWHFKQLELDANI